MFGLVSFASADEAVTSFDVRIAVHENATIEVTEQIVYDFGDTERHGIYRNIPYSYQAGTETYTAEISSVLVTDGTGKPQPFGESRGNGELTLKIGDPDVFVTGSQVYVISYIVKGPFLYFEEKDEFYWNVTGFWERPIQHASVLVDLPPGAQVLSAACYQGVDGSRTTCTSDERLVNSEQAGYTATAENMGTQEGLTVAVAFPKGSIAVIENAWEGKKSLSPYDFWPFAIPLLVLLYMLHVWNEHGRDPKRRASIVTQFAPPSGVSPAIASVIYHEGIRGKEISAEIIQLAIEGFIKIHRFEKKVLLFNVTDYLLERTGDSTPQDPLSAEILEKLFQDDFMGTYGEGDEEKKGVLLSRMKHKFVSEKKAVDELIYKKVVEQKFFVSRPDKVRIRYMLSGFMGGILLLVISIFLNAILFGIALLLSGLVVALVGYFMPVKTEEGARMKEYLEGFKRYLEVAEKDRLDFHASPEQDKAEPEKTMSLFDACLPYAIIFGVEEKWAEKFEDVYQEDPSWYSGGAGRAFAAGAFASDLSSFTSDISSASAPQSSGSGGGGSSGGGFGGGGGGSW